MTAIDATGTAAAIPTQHYAPKGSCGHHGLVPMPMPMPMPMPLPPGRGPLPPPADGTPSLLPPKTPPSMYGLSGGSTTEIAQGIVNLYDADRDGVISSQEAVRVQRDYGGFSRRSQELPGFNGQVVDVYSMTQLFVKADADADGRVGANELGKVLRGFDTGDKYGHRFVALHGVYQHSQRPIGKTAGDGRLSGSEFDRFIQQLGEQHVGSFLEQRFGPFLPTKPGWPAAGPGVPPSGTVATAAAPAGAGDASIDE